MRQRALQPSGSSSVSQGRVRSANDGGTVPRNTSANNSSTKDYRNNATAAGSLVCQLSAGQPSLDEWMRAIRARTFAGRLSGSLHFFGEPCHGTARGIFAFTRLCACLPLSGPRGPTICCDVPRSDSVKLTEDSASDFSRAASQLRAYAGVSVINAPPMDRAAVEPTFDARNLSPGGDSEINTKSQGDLSCRRNKRTRLPRSMRVLYESRSGDRIW